MNKAMLVGNLTRDPELRVTSSGISVCSFTVAVQRRYANQAGERQADFIPVVTWRALADNCGKYLVKGKKVGVVGTINTRNYEAADGTKRYVTEIVADEVEFLSPSSQGAGGTGKIDAPPSDSDAPAESENFTAIDDDDLPF